MRKVKADNPRYPHTVRIVRREFADRYSEGELAEHVIYEGPGRSYTDTTTTGSAKVDINKRKASIPVRFDEWKAPAGEPAGTVALIPMSGDIVLVTKGSITEEWEVKDFEPDNDRSVVYGQLNRNLNVE